MSMRAGAHVNTHSSGLGESRAERIRWADRGRPERPRHGHKPGTERTAASGTKSFLV